MTPDYTYIDTAATLQKFVAEQPTLFGFDTEFTYERTFNPIPELLQIASSHGIGIIDLRAGLDLSAIEQWFIAPDVTRIAYAAQNDIEVLAEVFPVQLGPIEDIQLALKFLKPGQSPGYAQVVEQYVGVELDKSMQRSRWHRRPLSQRQLDYAAGDIYHLCELWAVIRQELKAAGRLDWYIEERENRARYHAADDPALIYGKSGELFELGERRFHLFQVLHEWRTEQARLINIPKNWILSPGAVLKLSSYKKFSDKVLLKVLSPKQVNRHRRSMHRLQSKATALANASQSISPKRLKGTVRALALECATIAADLNLSEELLGPRRDLLFVLRSYLEHGELPLWFTTWRTQLIGDLVVRAAKEFAANGAEQ